MNKKFLPLIFFLLIPIYGCGNSNTKTGTTDIQISQEGMVDQSTRDIISKEYDAKGNLLNCTIGNSSWKRGLPSCNEIIDQRTKDFERIALNEQKRLEKEKSEKANLKLKETLLKDFESLINDKEKLTELANGIKGIREKWNDIGDIPEKFQQKIQKEYANFYKLGLVDNTHYDELEQTAMRQ